MMKSNTQLLSLWGASKIHLSWLFIIFSSFFFILIVFINLGFHFTHSIVDFMYICFHLDFANGFLLKINKDEYS
jgi:hypothetical protein